MAMATHATGQGSSSGSSQAGQATHPSGTSSRIDVNNATRAHPLFRMLDYIIRNTQKSNLKVGDKDIYIRKKCRQDNRYSRRIEAINGGILSQYFLY